ncbi:MAG: hypothetical protein RLZZ303_1409 [Candidatus Hydrogenedentota bacterium]|jgi:mannitol/fructose-specific phosphotransferase system IIA component (Ntr-type)/predicted transcriptional regulator
MDFSKYITPQQVLLHPDAADKAAVMRMLVEAIADGPLFLANPELTRETLESALLARETLAPTVVAPGTACPHARISGLIGAGGAVAILDRPIDFSGNGNNLVDLVVVLVVPAERPPVALKLLGKVAALGNPGVRAPLLAAANANTAAALLHNLVFNIDTPLLARDVMRPPHCLLTQDMPVTTIVQRMVQYNAESVGISTADGVLLGEITSDALFVMGVPEFFNQLKSVSFIKEFDPFDRYFEKESLQNAGEVMSTDVARVQEDATILEVIFLLSVRRYAKVYVERNGKLVGVIDRARVLNEILNV